MNGGDGWSMSSEGRRVLARTGSIAAVRKSRMGEGSEKRLRGEQRIGKKGGGREIGIQNMAEKWGILRLLGLSV